MSASADKTIVTWHFEKPVSHQDKEEEKARHGKEREEEEHEEEEGSNISTEITIKEYLKNAQKFFNKFPIRHLVEELPSFVYEYTDVHF